VTAASAPPLRVLHLCPDTRYLTQLFALYRDALDQPPFESTLVFLRGEPDAALAQRIGGRVQFLDLPRRALEGLRLPALWRLWRSCRGQRFDLVVAHRFKALTLGLALRRLGVARHVLGVVHEIGQFDGRRHRVIERARTAPLTLIGVSDAVRADLALRFPAFPAARIKALPNAVGDHPLLPRAQALSMLRLAPDWFWFGSIGRLVSIKGYDLLLQAFAPLAHEIPRLGLALVGTGREEAALRALSHDLGIEEQVAFCGWRADVRSLLGAFEVCVFPSREEGFGLAVAEAMVAERPVIASAVGGVCELLGDAALQVPVDEPAALTAALRRLHDDSALREAMGVALRARWQAEFSPPRFAARLQAFARDAIGATR